MIKQLSNNSDIFLLNFYYDDYLINFSTDLKLLFILF